MSAILNMRYRLTSGVDFVVSTVLQYKSEYMRGFFTATTAPSIPGFFFWEYLVSRKVDHCQHSVAPPSSGMQGLNRVDSKS